MKTLRQSIFLPVFALIAFLVFGAGTVLADSSNEGVGGWGSEAVGAGQVTVGGPSNLSGIYGSGDARFTIQATGSEPAGDEPNRRAFGGTLYMPETEGFAAASEINVGSITVDLQTSEGGEQVIGLPAPVTVGVDGLAYSDGSVDGHPYIKRPRGPRAGYFTDEAEVVVLAKQTEEGWQALWILVKPMKPNPPLHGVVIGVDGDKVKIQKANGDTETVTFPGKGRGLTTGEVVTFFRGNSGHAKGVVRAEEVKNRLEKFRDDAGEGAVEPEEVEGDGDGKGKNHDKAAAHLARIDAFLEGFNNRRAQLVDGVIDGAPERIKAKLVEVKERIHAQRLAHRQAAGRIWDRLDRIHPEHSHRGGSEHPDQRPDNSNRVRPDNSNRVRPEAGDPPRPERFDENQGGDRPAAGDGSDAPTP